MSSFLSVHPVLSVRDVPATVQWFCVRLGFDPKFCDDETAPKYAGVKRDGVELHLQWHAEEEWANGLCGTAYRFLVDDPDALFGELARAGVIPPGKVVADTGWGTREFGLYDPDGNALFFYRNLI